MALSDKITKAVKDAQKQAEAAAAEVRGQLDHLERKLPEVSVDPTPFYAVVGAANIALDTVKTAGEQLELARRQAKGQSLRKGAKKEARQMQQDLQTRIDDLQHRTAALQRLATTYADRFVTQAQDLPAQVLNQGLVVAGNAKDQFDAAAARGEKVVTDLRAQGERAAIDAAEVRTAAMTRGRRVVRTTATEGRKVAGELVDTVTADASKIGEQVEKSAAAVEKAATPVPVKRTAAHKRAIRQSSAQKSAATRKANDVEATTTRKVAARSSATTDDPQATVDRKTAPAKKAVKRAPRKAAAAATTTAKKTAATTRTTTKKAAATTAGTTRKAAAKTTSATKTAAENVSGATTS